MENKIKHSVIQIIRPVNQYVLISPDEIDKKRESGIYLPENNSERPQKGKVIAISKVTDNNKKTCDVGDVVFYRMWDGNEIRIEGKDYLFIKFEDIVGVS